MAPKGLPIVVVAAGCARDLVATTTVQARQPLCLGPHTPAECVYMFCLYVCEVSYTIFMRMSERSPCIVLTPRPVSPRGAGLTTAWCLLSGRWLCQLASMPSCIHTSVCPSGWLFGVFAVGPTVTAWCGHVCPHRGQHPEGCAQGQISVPLGPGATS